MNVAVVGASDDPEKYSNMAVRLLKEKGHRVFPVNPSLKNLEGLPVYASVSAIPEPIDTVSLYVSAKVSDKLAPEILKLAPRRILFNPGAENKPLEEKAAGQGIQALEACTLVMLRTSQFDRR